MEGFAEGGAFTFESGGFPDVCILDSGRNAKPKGNGSVIGPDETGGRSSQVCLTQDAERGGVFIVSENPGADPLGAELKALTIILAFRASPASPSPVFVERLVGGSSNNPGFFRFRSQSNSGDTKERTGTLRFYLNPVAGESLSAASTAPWTQIENAWNWVGLVFDHGRVRFYLNGERLGDEVNLPVESIPGAEGKPYAIRAGYGFTGALDDLVILPGKALGDEEMQELQQSSPDAGKLRKFTEKP